MAKIQLNQNVTVDITENGKTVKSFAVTYRELSKKEQRSMGKENEKILDLFKIGQQMDRRINATETKIEALKDLENAKELLSTAKKLDELYSQRDDLEDEFNELGGFDKMVEASKITFTHAVGGKDKEDLMVWIDENSDFGTILHVIAEDAKSQKGK